MNIKIEGMTELSAVLKSIPEKAKEAAVKQLKIDMLDLQGKARDKAPVLTGDLKGSADSGASAAVTGVEGFVSFDTPYATRQHEDMDYKHPNGGQAKYLEQPLKENIGTYAENMGKAIKEAVDKKL